MRTQPFRESFSKITKRVTYEVIDCTRLDDSQLAEQIRLINVRIGLTDLEPAKLKETQVLLSALLDLNELYFALQIRKVRGRQQ